MVMREAGVWFTRGKALLAQLKHQIMAPPGKVQPTIWYSGLGIEPAEFTGQLARLQSSLKTANKPVAQPVSDSARH
jgi:hypothetical protein